MLSIQYVFVFYTNICDSRMSIIGQLVVVVSA